MRSSIFTTFFLLNLVISFVSPFSFGQTSFDGILIQADSGERNLQNRSVELSGNIQIIFNGQHLSADRATIYQDRSEIEAEGHILFTTAKTTLGGNKIVINYKTNKGSVYSGFIQSGQVIFEGSVIEKRGEDEYFALQSQYTSCTTCPAAWSFAGQSIEAEIGGYALIKNSFLYFGTVPVIWLPYLIVPLKSERQTGLLTPSVEYSKREGLSLAQPFFWAISKHQDATFTVQSYANRGMKTLTNYRYILDKNSSGELDAGYIRDSYFGTSKRFSTFMPETSRINRWFMRYRHYYVLPENWIQRAEINNASDLQYTNDFPFETHSLGDPAMESRLSLTKNSEDQHFSIDTSYYVNLLKANPSASNNDSVHRLPEISLISTKKPLGDSGFLFNYQLRYTHFARNEFAYDDLSSGNDSEGKFNRQVTYRCANGATGTDPKWEYDPTCKPVRDGEFNPGTDLIRSGQRLIFEPSLTRPFQLGAFFNLIPRLSFRESHYRFGIEDVPDLTRQFLRTELRLQTTFSRIFGDLSDPYSQRYKHEFQPEVISTSVPWLSQPYHPFLGFTQSSEIPFFSREAASNSDLYGDNGIQFDYDDRLFDRNLVTYRVINKITKKSWDEAQSAATYDRLLTWQLSQTYDVYEAQSGGTPRPWSDIESILNINLNHFNTYTKINFFPYQKLADTSSQVTMNDDRGNYLKLGLTRKYQPDNEGVIDVKKRTEDYLLQVGTTAKYVNLAGRVIYNGNEYLAAQDTTRIKALTYAVILRPPGNCWGIHFLQHSDVSTRNTTYKLQFDFLFDGKASTQSPTKLLETYGF
ncbi:MAG: hypothetical protein RJB66_471 [Pseudomonadota bacterium]